MLVRERQADVEPPALHSEPCATGRRWVPLGMVDELAERGQTVVSAAGQEFLVVYAGRAFRVFANRCPHAGTRLDDARIKRATITCPMHGLRFSLADGAPVRQFGCRIRTSAALKMFASEIRDGWLYAVLQR